MHEWHLSGLYATQQEENQVWVDVYNFEDFIKHF